MNVASIVSVLFIMWPLKYLWFMNRPWQPVFVNALTTVSLNHRLGYSSLFSFMNVSMGCLVFMKADITVCFVHVCEDGKFCFTKASIQRKQEEGKRTVNMFVEASVAFRNMSRYLDM
jgi:hypothetical protein